MFKKFKLQSLSKNVEKKLGCYGVELEYEARGL